MLAHFTSTELPGTLAIWVAGIGFGLALGTRAGRAAVWPLALMAIRDFLAQRSSPRLGLS